jgi:hypothetical protein
MKNLDARIAASSQNTRVRAHSGRDPTTGTSRIGAPADAFEIVFRRMRSQALLAEPGAGDSPSQQNPESAQGSSPPSRAKVASFMRGRDRVQTELPTVARESGSPPRARTFGTNTEVRTADVMLPAQNADVSVAGFRPTSSAAAMMTPLAEEAVLGSVAAEAEQLISTSVTGLPVGEFISKSGAGPGLPTEQLVPKSGAGLPAEQFVPKSIAGLPAEQFIPESLRILPAEQFVPKSVEGVAVKARGIGVVEVALDGRAEFALPVIDGTMVDAKAIAFTSESQDAMSPADMSAYFPHESSGEFRAGNAQVGFVLDIPAHASETFLAGDASNRGQPQKMVGPAVGLLSEPVNGGTLSQLMPAQVVVHTTGIGREQLVDQIVRGVRVAQHNEATEVIVQLKPDFLGRLSIRVLADDYAMRVEIRAENAAVRQVLQDSLADLQQRLNEKGFAFDQFNVLADTGSNPQREPDWKSGSLPGIPSTAVGKSLEDASAAEQAPLGANGVIDYFA